MYCSRLSTGEILWRPHRICSVHTLRNSDFASVCSFALSPFFNPVPLLYEKFWDPSILTSLRRFSPPLFSVSTPLLPFLVWPSVTNGCGPGSSPDEDDAKTSWLACRQHTTRDMKLLWQRDTRVAGIRRQVRQFGCQLWASYAMQTRVLF